jgi:transcriptional regulator with XRE-family HTH domain
MGTRPRQRPDWLAVKLLRIRKQLGLSQSQLAKLLDFDQSPARISEYESGVKEPPLVLLLRYARVAKVCTCVLIDDDLQLPKNLKLKKRRRHSPH